MAPPDTETPDSTAVGRSEAGEIPATSSLTAIIVNWRREDETLAAVDALRAWRAPPALLVVDNGSGEARARRLVPQLDARELVLNETNRGFGAAHNVVLDRVATPYLLLLNNDASIAEEGVAALSALLDRQAEVGVVGPLLVHGSGTGHRIAAGGRDIATHMRTHSTAAERQREIESEAPFEVDYVPGTVALLRTELLRRLGGFDEDYFFAGEMADLCTRAREVGTSSWIVPTARSHHDLEVAGGSRDGLYRYYSLRNRFLFVARRRPAAERAQLRRAWTLRGLTRVTAALLTGHGARARSLWAAIVDGRAGRFGPAPGSIAG